MNSVLGQNIRALFLILANENLSSQHIVTQIGEGKVRGRIVSMHVMEYLCATQ
jgi:hypothetical protein